MKTILRKKLRRFIWIPVFTGMTLAVFAMGAKTAFAGGLVKAPNNLGLVGYWSLDDNSGLTATDFSGRGNKGTLTNMEVADWVDGRRGKALDFDGVNDIVNIGAKVGVYDLTTDLSAFIWVKTTDTAWDAFGSLHGNGGWGVGTGGCSSGIIGGYVGSVWRCASTAVNDGVWHHVGVTLDSASGGTLKYYIDGVQNGSTVTSAGAFRTPAVSGSTGLNIGDEQTNSRPFAGQLDEARIYNRALSATEVAELYQQSSKFVKITNVVEGLVAYYPMNEGSGNRTADATGQGRAGVLAADSTAPTWVSGKFGNGLSFDGSNDYLSLSAVPAQSVPMTFAFWAKPAGSSPVGMFDTAPSVGSVLRNYPPGYVEWHSEDPKVALNLTADEWAHLAFVFTYDGTRHLSYYKNGVFQETVNGGSTATANWTTLILGNINSGGAGSYSGLLDDFRIYNRALSAADVRLISALRPALVSTSQNTIAPSSLVLWHTFDGAYLNTTTSTDRSASGYNGTLSGGPVPVLGKVGQAMKFDATNDYINLGSVTTLTSGSPFSISWWEKVTASTVTYPGRFSLKMSGTANYFVVLRPQSSGGGYGLLSWGQSPGSSFRDNGVVPTPANSIGTWRHFVITGSNPNTTNSSDYAVYMDGAVISHVGGSGYASVTDNSISLQSPYPAEAILDDVRIYNKALSAAEVLALYNQGI